MLYNCFVFYNNKLILYEPIPNMVTYVKRLFAYGGPRLWNNLDNNLCKIVSIEISINLGCVSIQNWWSYSFKDISWARIFIINDSTMNQNVNLYYCLG